MPAPKSTWDLLVEALTPKQSEANMSLPRSMEMTELPPAVAAQVSQMSAQQKAAATPPADFVAQQAQMAPAFDPMTTGAPSSVLQKRNEILDQIQAFQDKRMQEEQTGIDDYQKAIGQYGSQPLQYDLTPLAALVDQWAGGGNLMAAAQAMKPQTVEARQKELMALKKQLQDMRGSLTKNQLDAYKAKLNAIDDGLRMTSGERQDRQLLKMEDTVRKDFNKISDEFKKDKENLNTLEDHVDSGDTRRISMVISSIARNVGEQKGSLSDGDVARSLPPDIATSWSQLEAYMGSRSNISPELQAALKNLIISARDKSNITYDESIARRQSQYSAGSYAPLMQQGRVGDVIVNEAKKLNQKVAPQASSGDGSLDVDKRKRLEELRARKSRGEF